ncbi:SMP-30/gluconolactonase/LRE family protein [Gordonia sp. DT30]|uniref:SMP-30/gluconolactonase/LRE family protein n=1 Tax=unclassified Gordonia (in: high G+C Gram-positive bacteria) TaxID=2657482 RepID=UPI003CED542C
MELPKPRLEPRRRVVPAAGALPAPTRPFPPARLIPLPGRAPEDVVVGADGQLYCGLEGGAIVRVDPTTLRTEVVADTGGRPLGLLAYDDGLIVCDSHRGLLRVDPATGSVDALVERVDGVPLRFCSNAALAPDGAIWFTESSTRFGFEHYMGAFLEHRPSGRLLRRDPDGTVTVIHTELDFPNGLTLAPSQDALIMVETGGYRISRVRLADGATTTLTANLPGFPDNLSIFRDGLAWVAFTNPRSAALDRAGRLPGWVRRAIWRLPDALIPGPREAIWVRAITEHCETVHDIRSVRGDFAMATGVVEHDGFLYVAGPPQGALLRLDLSGSAPEADNRA